MRQSKPAETAQMEFVPLHFGSKLRIVNPRARLGIITLWSRADYVVEQFEHCGIDLDPATSRIAVIGTLYGNGMPHLLRNLLYNPQITHLAVCGANRSGSAEELEAFFADGLEKAESLGETVTRIKGTNRIIDEAVTSEMFGGRLSIVRFGDLGAQDSLTNLCNFIQHFAPGPMPTTERVEVPLPEAQITTRPSEPRAHTIVKDTPLAAWRELVFRLVRFGRLVHLRKGDRQELQNVKVVIREPAPDSADALAQMGFSMEDLRQYAADMLEAPLPADHSYTYGNRIREYFGFDALEEFAGRLRDNPQDRDCYLALWDSREDVRADDSPCMVSMFFRVFEERLTLTACYRTHNALDAWMRNVYGLMKAQEVVSGKCGIPIGAITVISHSISIDPSRYETAQRVANAKAFALEMDPNGQFLITVDSEAHEIVVQHTMEDGRLIHEYRSAKPERIQYEISRDCAISEISHAIYVGRQLARAAICLETGEPFDEN